MHSFTHLSPRLDQGELLVDGVGGAGQLGLHPDQRHQHVPAGGGVGYTGYPAQTARDAEGDLCHGECQPGMAAGWKLRPGYTAALPVAAACPACSGQSPPRHHTTLIIQFSRATHYRVSPLSNHLGQELGPSSYHVVGFIHSKG